MRIRRMTIDDYEGVRELWMSCSGMGLNNLDDSKDGIERFLARNPDTCFVAEDGRVIGAILVGHDGRRGYVYHTSVGPELRHRNIGTQLVEASLSALRALKINKVALVVFGRNEGGNLFWEQQGFSVRDDLVYRDRALTHMVRTDT